MGFRATVTERIRWRRRLRAAASLEFWTSTIQSLVVAIALVGVGLALSILLPPLDVLPSESTTITGIVATVLQAQAAMMAISLAVMAFIVGGVQRREDLDDPLYEWFLARAFVRPVFALAAALTLGTGAAYLFAQISGPSATPNAILFAVSSLGAVVLIVVGFALWALRVLRPSQYRLYKRQVTIGAVRSAAVAYTRFVRALVQDQNPDGGGEMELASSAGRAVQQIVDDAEMAIRGARFTDFEQSVDTIRSALKVAIADGSLRDDHVDRAKLASVPMPWPTGLELVFGLERLDRICLRDRLTDHSQRLHYLPQDWVRYSIGWGNDDALFSSLASVEREYVLARVESAEDQRMQVASRARSLLFYSSNQVRSHMIYPLNREQRQGLSRVLVEAMHRHVGRLLEAGDNTEACEWLDELIRYAIPERRLGGEELREFSSPSEDGGSVQEVALVVIMALIGRAFELGNFDVLSHIQATWFKRDGLVEMSAALASSVSVVVNNVPRLSEVWASWRHDQRQAGEWEASETFPSDQYVLVAYLWLASRPELGESIRALPVDDAAAIERLRELWRAHGQLLVKMFDSGGPEQIQTHALIAQWLGLTSGS